METELLAQQLMRTFLRVSRAMRPNLNEIPKGILPMHVAVLHHIHTCPCSQSELAEHIHSSPATVSTMIGNLARRGLVERQPSATDRRVVMLSITPSGVALLHVMQAQMLEKLNLRLQKFTPEECLRLAEAQALLERLFV
ncbi:MAG TPA: MarR family transcriptional regulator [Anaerolineales bacterium]|nr:MarR family transcriptional regulator [Anaerolineales bacterium]